MPKLVFRDSLTYLNFGYPYRALPCAEHAAEPVPCHHIPLDQSGRTVEDLEIADNQQALEESVKVWLRARTAEMESTGPNGRIY